MPPGVNITSMPDSSLTRPYRGVAAADRVAARRAALIDAALEVFAADGWAALSARRVSEQAGLTRRYFYESFDDIDDLIAAAFERISSEARDAVRAAVADGAAPLPDLVKRAVSAALDVLAVPASKGRFFVVAQSAIAVPSTRRGRPGRDRRGADLDAPRRSQAARYSRGACHRADPRRCGSLDHRQLACASSRSIA